MFDRQYAFKGKHAELVDKLSRSFAASGACLFDQTGTVYVNAPLVGFLYQRTAELDRTKMEKYPNGKIVMGDSVLRNREELEFNYRMIMLLDETYEPDLDKRLDKAFYHFGEDPKDGEHFQCYVRGGVEVLYEKLIAPAEKSISSNNKSRKMLGDYYIQNLAAFIDEVQTKFNEKINEDIILTLCQIGK